jgi:hypothetical protein
MIFISYRREDAVGHAGRLFDRLVEEFGRDRVVRDIDTIAAGDDFVEVVTKKIKQSDVLLAVIGPRWLTATDEEGHWRLADENDMVRREIVTALAANIRVIPVLVQAATMPKAKDLPGELAPLAQRNAVEIRDKGFDVDVAQLIQGLWPNWRHKFVRLFARKPTYAAVFAVAAVGAGFWLYPYVAVTPEEARVRLQQMGWIYDEDHMVEAAKRNDVQVVKLLMRAGMNPNAESSEGRTALIYAAANRNIDLVKYLVENGADVNPAFPWATGSNRKEIFDYLLATGKVNKEATTMLWHGRPKTPMLIWSRRSLASAATSIGRVGIARRCKMLPPPLTSRWSTCCCLAGLRRTAARLA